MNLNIIIQNMIWRGENYECSNWRNEDWRDILEDKKRHRSLSIDIAYHAIICYLAISLLELYEKFVF